MNSKIIIPISIIITIVIVAFSFTQSKIMEQETLTQFKETDETERMLEKIKEDKIKNDNSNNPYVLKQREWITSGPFQIDRSEYSLGEKIFVNVNILDKNTKGEMVFSKIINSTHILPYHKIQFDGSQKNTANLYFGLYPSKLLGICTGEELSGDWKVIFSGTNYENLKFKIKNQIVPGTEERFQSVC